MSPTLRDNLKKEVKDLTDYVSLLVVNAKNYQKSRVDILNYLLGTKKIPGVYITLNKPYDILIRELSSNKHDTNLVIFIDCITMLKAGKMARVQNCLFIGTPEKLSDMFVAIDQAVNSISLNERFVFLDSLNTMSMFNSGDIVARFTHQLVARMRNWKVAGIIMTIQKEKDDTLLNEITPFCDFRIDLK